MLWFVSSLNQIQCNYGEQYDQKYIIVTVNDGNKTRALLVSKKLRYHSNIANSYAQEIPSQWETNVHGGGILKIDPKKKKISTYGTSGGYGAPCLTVVEAILQSFVQNHYPGWDLEVKVTDYIRE